MEAISFLTPRPGRTNSGRIKSWTVNLVSRTRSRSSGRCRSRRDRTLGKPPCCLADDSLLIGASLAGTINARSSAARPKFGQRHDQFVVVDLSPNDPLIPRSQTRFGTLLCETLFRVRAWTRNGVSRYAFPDRVWEREKWLP